MESPLICLTPSHPHYPPFLKPLRGAPKQLYVAGSVAALSKPSISIVGSRKMTSYGAGVLEHFVPELVAAGLTIVSGLAYGVDSYAHQLALQAKGSCVAVLGGGLRKLYPARHRSLFEEIITSGGVVISEYEPEMPPLPEYFPQRNRIIAGMSQVTLVVEAGETSGSLITAHQAVNYGRDICVIPGDITRPTSAGITRLLKEGTVMAVDCVQDILTLYQVTAPIIAEGPLLPALTGSPATLYDSILQGINTLEGLTGQTGWTTGRVQSVLSVLELDGYIAFRDYKWQKTS